MIRPQTEEIVFALLFVFICAVMVHSIMAQPPMSLAYHVELRPLPQRPVPQLRGDLDTPGLYAIHRRTSTQEASR